MKEKIIALYIRLSVEDRDLDELKTASVSIQNQKVHLRNFLMCHPETASGEIREFIDDGYTGTNMDRPAFQEMMKLAREEQISCIVVKDFSRFGRNYLEVGNYLEQIFPLLGIRFISVDDGYDSKQKQGDVPGLDVFFNLIQQRNKVFAAAGTAYGSTFQYPVGFRLAMLIDFHIANFRQMNKISNNINCVLDCAILTAHLLIICCV